MIVRTVVVMQINVVWASASVVVSCPWWHFWSFVTQLLLLLLLRRLLRLLAFQFIELLALERVRVNWSNFFNVCEKLMTWKWLWVFFHDLANELWGLIKLMRLYYRLWVITRLLVTQHLIFKTRDHCECLHLLFLVNFLELALVIHSDLAQVRLSLLLKRLIEVLEVCCSMALHHLVVRLWAQRSGCHWACLRIQQLMLLLLEQ